MITRWESEGWFIIYAIATVVMAITIVSTAIFAYRQLRELRKSRQADAFVNLIRILQDQEIREARGVLIQDLSRKQFTEWTDKERVQAERVCHTYDAAGIINSRWPIEKDFLARENWNSIVMCWEAARPLIVEYRKHRGKEFWKNFEALYRSAKQYDTRQAEKNEANHN